MAEIMHVELTKSEREVLLRGLRYVRSSIMLDVRDPEPEDESRRASELQEIAGLVDRLNGMASASTPASV